MAVILRDQLSAVVSIRDGLLVRRVNEPKGLSFAGAESEALKQMVVSVMRIEDNPLPPRHIKRAPFLAELNSDRSIEFRRQGDEPGEGLRISFDEGDDLIWLIDTAMSGYLAETQTIGRAPASGPKPYWPQPDPPISGR